MIEQDSRHEFPIARAESSRPRVSFGCMSSTNISVDFLGVGDSAYLRQTVSAAAGAILPDQRRAQVDQD